MAATDPVRQRPAGASALRRALDGLYNAAAMLAAVCMVGLLGMILVGIVGRLLHVLIPGTDSYAGYLMAGCGFLALAHTLKRGEHIRVTLLRNALKGKAARVLDVWALTVAVVISAALAFYSVRLVWLSYVYHDVSTGNDATPLWIPQISMAAGACVLLIALLDEWVLEWRGERRAATTAEALRNE